MNSLLDTHFFVWILQSSPRLAPYAWLGRYRPWGVSPLSLLEVAYLAERGRIEVEDVLLSTVAEDPRFEIDEISLMTLTRHAIPLSWTRDPFDRLIAAHSAARRIPLCSVDDRIRRNHTFVPAELSLT